MSTIPVLGYADDAVIVAIALRSVVRRAGPEALERHWPGTRKGSTSSGASPACEEVGGAEPTGRDARQLKQRAREIK